MKRDVSESETLVGDLMDLRAFCLTVDLRSLTLAAKALGESKATLSRRIARLEASLSAGLLRRSPRLVEPTEDGLAYRARVGRVLELLRDANSELQGGQSAPAGTLRVTSPPEFNGILAPLVASFGERHPRLRIDMVVTQHVLDLDAEHVDVALRVTFDLRDSPLVAHQLLPLRAIAVAAPSYLRGRTAPQRLEDLAEHRLVYLHAQHARRGGLSFRHERSGELSLVRHEPHALSSDMNFIRDLAVAGGGIAVLPDVTVTRELDDGRLVRVVPAYALAGARLHLFHRAERFLPSKVRAFRDFLLDAFGAKGRRLNGTRR